MYQYLHDEKNKNTMALLIFVWVSHLQLFIPTMSAGKAALHKPNINQEAHGEANTKEKRFLWHMMKYLWQQQVALEQTPIIQLMVQHGPKVRDGIMLGGKKQDISIPFHMYYE